MAKTDVGREQLFRELEAMRRRISELENSAAVYKHAEEHLRESERKYRVLLSHLPQKIFHKDRDSLYLACNDSYARDLKITPEEIIGKTDYDFFPEDLARKYIADDRRVVESGEEMEVEESYIENGQEKIVHTVKTPVKDEDGNVIGIIGIFTDITERKLAETALLESEKKYSTLVERGNDGIIIIQEGLMKFVNTKMVEMTGYSVEEAVNKSFIGFVSPEYREVVVERYKRRLAGESVPRYYEIEIIAKDSKIIPVEINASIIEYDGKPADMAIVRDITERKEAEQQLRDSEELYRNLFESTHDLIQSNTPDGRLLFVNRAWQETLGYTEAEIPNLNLFEIIHPESLPHCQDVFTQVMAGKTMRNIQATFITKDGRLVLLEGSAVPRYVKDKPVATLCFLHDISSHKQAEQALQESEERYRTIIEDANHMIQSVKPDGSFIFVNPAWRQTLGYTEEELPGLNMFNIIHPESRAHCQEMFAKVMGGESVQNVSATFVAKDGRKVLVEGNAAPRYMGEKIIATQGIFRDVTESKRAEEEIKRLYEQVKIFNIQLEGKIKERTAELEIAVKEAEAANKAKSEFLAGMSHELRTPLTAIIGFSQVLAEQYFGELNEKQAEYVKDILESGEHLLSLINDILDLAKVEAGKAELELSRVNVKELLDNSLIMIKEKALRHSLRLETQISPDLSDLLIFADERKLKQIMFNLLSNAAKFTPDHGRITVGGSREGSELIISVTDTGIGISPKDQRKIFDEFYQVRSGPKDKTPGTGLGLSLSKHLVEMHGGKIRVESEGKNKGSTFTFSLPIQRDNQEMKQ